MRRQRRLYILAGIPGCGKSTWARKFMPSDAVVISSDQIRQENFGPRYDADQNGKVFAIFYDRIRNYLPYQNVVADATNLQPFAREELRKVADECNAETHLVFFDNAEQAVVRNASRSKLIYTGHGDKCVPDESMQIMLDKFEGALRDIPTEKYTTTTYISVFG